MDTPLTRQYRPDYFEPKIVELYRYLFHVLSNNDLEESTPSEGFWTEFFLLKPDKHKLYQVLDPLTAENLLQIQTHTRLFFKRAIAEATSAVTPRNENALESLTGFLCAVFTKRFTNPSTDVIEVLAGLDDFDAIVSDLVQGIEVIIRQGGSLSLRQKAVNTALATVSGSYQTTLVTYFIHRDLFPALMKLAKETTSPVPEIMVLLGLLANYNKFESQNLYHHRLEDFVNTSTISQLMDVFAHTCRDTRDQYVVVQDDSPAPWTISSTLTMVGLRSLTPDGMKNKPAALSEDEAKAMFANLPNAKASILMSAYSFVDANKIFASQLISAMPSADVHETHLSAFLSMSSYICHHAHRTHRSLNYATLILLTLRLLSEDSAVMKRLCSHEEKVPIRLARQRQPLLPLVDRPRIPITAILDICSDLITHNLRKRLSVSLYSTALNILVRIMTHLESTKTRLQHHWSQTWSSIFSLLRFLTQYQSDLAASPSAYQIRDEICTPLTSLLAFCLSRGDNFLPDPASYDDLFYKLIEASALIPKFKAAYCPKSLSSNPTGQQLHPQTMLLLATNALLSVTSHYENLLTSKLKTHQSPATVQKVIREGYDTLPDIGASPATTTLNGPTTMKFVDFGQWEKFREVTWKSEIKKILRTVVEDARTVCLTSR